MLSVRLLYPENTNFALSNETASIEVPNFRVKEKFCSTRDTPPVKLHQAKAALFVYACKQQSEWGLRNPLQVRRRPRPQTRLSVRWYN